MKIIKTVRENELLPRFYGVAWRSFNSPSIFCLPVPLNLIVGVLRSMWMFCKHGSRRIYMNPRAAYDQGRRDQSRKYPHDLWISVKEKPIPSYTRLLVRTGFASALVYREAGTDNIRECRQDTEAGELIKWTPAEWMHLP